MNDADIAKLKTDLKNVCYYIKYSSDKEKLREIVHSDESFHALRRDTVEMLNEVCKFKADNTGKGGDGRYVQSNTGYPK